MTTKGNKPQNFERLKDELRQLRRAGAPWYFESELHQRLLGMRRRHRRHRPFELPPIMGFSLVLLVVILIGISIFVLGSGIFPWKPAGTIEERPGPAPSQIIAPVPPDSGKASTGEQRRTADSLSKGKNPVVPERDSQLVRKKEGVSPVP